MPLIAVAIAAIADIGVAGTVGGLIAGTATLTVTSALEITAAVGATIGAVGAVTRDKGLQTAGLVLGGIGGVGALASAAGLFSDGASLVGDTASAASSAAAGATDAGAIGTDTIQQAVAAGMTPTDFLNSTPDMMSWASSGSAGGDVSSAPAGLLNNSGAGLAPTPAGAEVYNPATQQPPAPYNPTTSAGAEAANNVSGIPSSVAIPGNQAAGPTGLGGALQGISNFATSSPLATYGLIQAGGALVSGLFNPVTPAQVAALDAQAAQNRAAASIQATQAANMLQPEPVAGLKPVASAPVTGAPAASGLINSGITGAPAPVAPPIGRAA